MTRKATNTTPMIGSNVAASRGAATGSCMVVIDMPASEFLPGRPVKDLVDVDVLRLAHREGNRPCERFGRNRHLFIKGPDALRCVWIGDRVGKFGRDRARRNDRRSDIVRLDLLAQPFRERAYRVLRGSVDGEAWPDPVARDGGNVDEVACLLPLHVRQRRGNAVEYTLDVD